jgi:hypothetical protein
VGDVMGSKPIGPVGNLSIWNKKINQVIGAWEATLLYVLFTLLKYENVYGSKSLARKQKEILETIDNL